MAERDGVFQYRRRVPKEILDRPAMFLAHFGGKDPFRRSLRTKDRTEAYVRLAEVHADFERRLSLALGVAAQVPARHLRPITRVGLLNVREQQRLAVTRPFRNLLFRRSGGDDAAHHELERLFEQLEQDGEDIRGALIGNMPARHPAWDVGETTRQVIEVESLDAPLGSKEWSAVATAIREGMLQGYREISGHMDGSLSILPQGTPSRKRAPKLSEMVHDYAGSIAGRSRTEVLGALRGFVDAVADLPVNEISRAHVRSFCEREAGKDVGGRARNSIKRPMSFATLDKKMRLLRAAVSRAKKREVYEGENPFADFDVSVFVRRVSKAAMPDKRPFTVGELNRVLQYPWFTGCQSPKNLHAPGDHLLTGMHYWGPIMAMFTGCRAGELGGLMVNEVQLEGATPHIVIRDNAFRRTKGAYQRNVPILDQLLEIGFAEFVERARAEKRVRLFSDWVVPKGVAEADDPRWSNGAMVRSFNATLIPKVLEGLLLDDARREVTFHSFRGAFKSLLMMQRYGIQTNIVHEVVGHAKIALDKRYQGTIALEETYPAVRACRYEGLVLVDCH